MQNMKILLALGACFGAAVVAACSSSSSGNPGAPTDAGGGEDVTTADSGDDGSTTCLPLGGTGCAKGSACCLDLSGGIAALASGGMCVMPGTCQYSIEVACTQGSDCNSGQVCCATLGGAGDGGTLAELEEGGLAALGLDASALSLDAGGDAGLAGLNINFKTSCSSSCTGNQIQVARRTRSASAVAPASPSPACWAMAGATPALRARRAVSACTRPRSGATWRASRPPAMPPRSRIRERVTPWHRRMPRPTRCRSERGERGAMGSLVVS